MQTFVQIDIQSLKIKKNNIAACGLSLVDWHKILIYFCFFLGIGLYLCKLTKNQEGYILAGRSNFFWAAGLASLYANLGALKLFVMTGNTSKYEMYVACFYWIGAIQAVLFLSICMMPFYCSSKIYFIPSYLKLRFNEKTRVLNSIYQLYNLPSAKTFLTDARPNIWWGSLMDIFDGSMFLKTLKQTW